MTAPTPAPSSVTRHDGEMHEIGALNTLMLCGVLSVCVLVGYFLKQKKIYYMPESAAVMLLGVIIGGVVELFSPSREELSFLTFDPELFFFVLLPPIIFEAGYMLNKKGFFSNFTTILLFAVLGTLISTFVIGGLLYGCAELQWVRLENHTPIEALLFGALISAVDPVATLSIVGAKELNCDPLLYALIFGESVLNDAVAIVLFRTLQGFETDTTFSTSMFFGVIGEFIGVSLGSVFIGVLCGLLCSLVMKRSQLHKYPKYEITALLLTAFGSYALAESIEWNGGSLSGIMALFFCGISLSHYNFYNLSETSQVSSSFIFQAISHLSETIVFAYIGTSLFSSAHKWDFALVTLAVIFCIIGRACNTFPLSFLSNCRRKKKIPLKMQVVIWFAGLRGAIAFALATTLNTPNAPYIVTTTLSIVMFTTIICGGLTEPLLRRMGMQRAPRSAGRIGRSGSNDLSQDLNPYSTMSIHALDGSGGAVRRRSGGLHGLWRNFDNRVMKPIFGGADPRSQRPDRRGAEDVLIGSDGHFSVNGSEVLVASSMVDFDASGTSETEPLHSSSSGAIVSPSGGRDLTPDGGGIFE